MKQHICIFEEEAHKYFLKDAKTGVIGKELISVTTLMRKHGLAPDYSDVPSNILKAKAQYGTLVHKELEDFIKFEMIGFTPELQQFIDYCNNTGFKPAKSEFIVHNDIVAGTVDVLGQYNGCTILGDFKTTATLHKEAVRWQLSIYAYLAGETLDGLQAFHFADGLKVVDIEPIPVAEVEKLLDAERRGVKYEQRQLVVENDLMMQLAEAEETIKHFELQKKEAETNAAKLREKLLEAMQAQGVKSFENERLKITYIEAGTRETIDGARLKKEMPEVAEQYKKISNIKESVRITLKK